jgi:2-amino-4-hydroxy-6-hydroxymethyldihydropteridine diphosphokinase
MAVAYISVGSNSGERLENCEFGVSRMFASGRSSLLGRSRIYETEPVGFKNQGWFLNFVVKIQTDLEPEELLKALKDIEAQAGRDFGQIRFGPRTLDLDILLYDDRVVHTQDLVIPHPRMHERRFVLRPLCDLNEDMVHPVLKKKASRLLDELAEDEQEVVPYKCDC